MAGWNRTSSVSVNSRAHIQYSYCHIRSGWTCTSIITLIRHAFCVELRYVKILKSFASLVLVFWLFFAGSNRKV